MEGEEVAGGDLFAKGTTEFLWGLHGVWVSLSLAQSISREDGP